MGRQYTPLGVYCQLACNFTALALVCSTNDIMNHYIIDWTGQHSSWLSHFPFPIIINYITIGNCLPSEIQWYTLSRFGYAIMNEFCQNLQSLINIQQVYGKMEKYFICHKGPELSWPTIVLLWLLLHVGVGWLRLSTVLAKFRYN